MPPIPNPVNVNPQSIARSYFVGHEGKKSALLEAAFGREYPQKCHWEPWVQVVREDARITAINFLWGLLPRCHSLTQVREASEAGLRTCCPLALDREIEVWEEEFRREVVAQMDVWIALRGSK